MARIPPDRVRTTTGVPDMQMHKLSQKLAQALFTEGHRTFMEMADIGARAGMNADKEVRRAGRPKLAAGDRKSAIMRFRTRDDVRNKLEAAAKVSGRTLNEEAELRLVNSFELEPLHQLFYGQGHDAARFLHVLVATIRTIQGYENPPGVQLGKTDWMTSDLTRCALRAALPVLMEYSIPPEHAPEETPWTPSERRQYAAMLAHMREFGAETAELMTGQRPDLEEALSRDGASEH